MKREFHVRFWEGGGVRFPSATRPGIGHGVTHATDGKPAKIVNALNPTIRASSHWRTRVHAKRVGALRTTEKTAIRSRPWHP